MIKILARYDDKVTNLVLENAKKKWQVCLLKDLKRNIVHCYKRSEKHD